MGDRTEDRAFELLKNLVKNVQLSSKKILKVKNSIRTVARGCYCGAICTCYNASSAKAAYTASKAVGWSSADVGI